MLSCPQRFMNAMSKIIRFVKTKMQTIKYTYVFVIIALSTIFLSLTAAQAQSAVNYRFLEVTDTDGKPVAGASIETLGDCREVRQTDQNGQLEKGLRICRGDDNTTGFKVSKSGYFSYEDIGFISGPFSDRTGQPIRLELLIIPKTDAEREAVGDEQRKREFFMAAKSGDSAVVRKLLQAGLSANLTTTDLRGVPISKNIPVIEFAATSGNGETVKVLLAAGAKLPDKNKPKFNALMSYLEAGFYSFGGPQPEAEKAKIGIYEDGLRKLIEAGADAKARDSDSGRTTLMLAALGKTIGTIKILLDNGVSVNAEDKYGNTALMNTVMNRRLEIVELLLKSGADPNQLTYYSPGKCQTALMRAGSADGINIIQVLIANKADVNLACQDGETALLFAVRNNQVKVVKTLIEAGANVKGEQGATALTYARQHQFDGLGTYRSDYQEIIKLLEAAGAL